MKVMFEIPDEFRCMSFTLVAAIAYADGVNLKTMTHCDAISDGAVFAVVPDGEGYRLERGRNNGETNGEDDSIRK